MRCTKKRRLGNVGSEEYANSKDFRRAFADNMDELYLLALLLTADYEKAERSFVAGAEDSVQANQVFRQWAHSWAKRTIIQHAIHAVNPQPTSSEGPPISRVIKDRLR